MKNFTMATAALLLTLNSLAADPAPLNPLDDPRVVAALLAAARNRNPLSTTIVTPTSTNLSGHPPAAGSTSGVDLNVIREILRGNEGGHGGDPYSLEFSDIATAIGTQVNNASPSLRSVLDAAKLNSDRWQSKIQSVRILSADQDDVVLRGGAVDAINFPDLGAILVNRNRWRESDLTSRVRLVLHEFLGLMAIEQDKYDVSNTLGDLVQNTVQGLRTSTDGNLLMTNLFYGQCLAFPAVGTTDICDQSAAAVTQAEDCSKVQALGHCKVDGQSSCQIISTSYRVVISTASVGLRYCEVLTVLK